jgi:hypothetical protein
MKGEKMAEQHTKQRIRRQKTDKEMELVRKELREVGDQLVRSVKGIIDTYVILCDSKRLRDLARTIDMMLSYEVVRGLREKGFTEEIAELCDRAGRKETWKK